MISYQVRFGYVTSLSKILPQLYIGGILFVQFLLSVKMDFLMLFSFYFCWFYLRFFMTNKLDASQFGDSSSNFALHTFFPESMQP